MSSLLSIINTIGAWATLIIVFGFAIALGAMFGVDRPHHPTESNWIWWIE